jgi:hypothetical protein
MNSWHQKSALVSALNNFLNKIDIFHSASKERRTVCTPSNSKTAHSTCWGTSYEEILFATAPVAKSL